ncbi:YkvA family protein [Phycicoccus sp. Soil748]|uniref:YkvA family protein n=1 Tax=Intrasporangiaceae TaxID=85021 RepID=UPI0009E91EAF|nr:YkvA family protein [Phycicoccus sp. Soil748]
MAVNRWGALRTIASALRTALRPGTPSMGERAASVPRLLRATFRGEYTGTTRGRLLMIAAAVAYVVSPIDVVPEAFLSVLGLADDAVVASWIAAALVNETESFLRWERTGSPLSSDSFGGSRGRRRGAGRTVPGHVVR